MAQSPSSSTAPTPPAATGPARERLLEAASRLLAESGGVPVSTRAVCTAAGVGAPTLYHHFGDKDGLFDAVLAEGYGRFRAAREQAEPAADPVSGVRREWDALLEFGLVHPSLHVLLHGTARPSPPDAAGEAQAPLLAALRRAAAAGRLRTTPEAAAELLAAACVGVTATLLGRATPDSGLATAAREAVVTAVTLPAHETDEADEADGSARSGAARGSATAARASVLREALAAGAPGLTPNETALLRDWLARIAEH